MSPLADYRCPNPACGHKFETLFKHDIPTRCAKCGTEADKMITKPSGFVFKGSGFHATDYPKEG